MIRNISLLGSNNDIGIKAINFFKSNKNNFNIYSISYDSRSDNLDFFISQIKDINPKKIFVPLKEDAKYIESKIKIEIFSGSDNFPDFIKSSDIDEVVSSLSGISSVKKILSSIYEYKDITLLNTSPLLYCGKIIINEVRSKGVKLNVFSYPVYSLDFIFKTLNTKSIKSINLFTNKKEKNDFVSIDDSKNFISYLKKYYSQNNIRLVNDMFIINYIYNISIDSFSFFTQSKKVLNLEANFINGTSILFKSNLNIDSIFNYYFLENNFLENNPKKDNDEFSISFKQINFVKDKFLSLGLEALKKGGSYPIIYYISIETLLNYIYKRKIKENINIYKITK
jgi:hypothetical protein